MRDQDPHPAEPEGAAVHRLAPLEFDRADLAYYAACSCGHRCGPRAAVASLRAAFERHRAPVEPPPDRRGCERIPPGRHDEVTRVCR